MRQIVVVIGLLPGVALAEGPTVPRYAEVTGQAGISHSYTGEWEQMVGGGAASFDCDGNGLPELFLSGGTVPAQLLRNVSAVGGDLRFEPVESGLELELVAGAYPLDVDSDGVMDLVLLRLGENVVMRGLGNCRFERANEAWGFDGGDAWSTAFAATWEDGQSWPTLAVGNYINHREEAFPWGSCTDNWLHRPAGETGFAPPLPLTPSFCALSMLFTDWDLSGVPSLRVSNDREYYKGGQEQMWHVEPGQPPALYSPEEGWQRLRIWGMGIASSDVTGDGYPDYFLTSMADNKLQTLAPQPEGQPKKPAFADVAFARGVTAHRPYTGGEVRPSTAWHAQFEDVNNDTYPDLFVVKGNVWAMPDFAMRDPNNLLLQDAEGKFHEAGDKAGVASFESGRGGVVVDFNLDGLMDIAVVNRNGPAELWQNVTEGGGHWLALRPASGGINPDGIGGWIEVRQGDDVQRRELTVGGGHVSGQAGWWHFGLGGLDEAEVRMVWPDGKEEPWQRLTADSFYILGRGQAPEAWSPGG